MSKKIIFLCSLCLLLSFRNDKLPIATVVKALNDYYIYVPHEKIYLHTDKNFYLKNETIWLQAYLKYDRSSNLDSLSKILYVELIDGDKNVVEHRTIAINENVGKGDIFLSSKLEAGNYQLRAYTSWLRNIGEEYFFQKSITVYDAEKATTLSKASDVRPQIEFFAEGGNFIYGLKNIVAFKANDKKGLPVMCKGVIVNKKGNVFAKFESNVLGTGKFRITPIDDKLFAKVLFDGQTDSVEVKLPSIQAVGLNMIVEHIGKDTVKITTQNNIQNFPNKETEYMLIGHVQGEVVFTSSGNLKNNVTVRYLPKKELPTGVLHITVLDKQGIPYAERLLFIDQRNYLKVQITPNKTVFDKREKVEFTVTTTDTLGQPVAAHLSVGVVDAQKVVTTPYTENIKSRLLLTSELKGYIHQPAYYFEPTMASSQALDELMLTQGWRRFKWQDILSKPNYTSQLKYSIEQGITIDGVVEGAFRKSKGGSVVGLLPNKSVLSTEVAENGRFSLAGFHFYDTMTVVLQARNAKNVDNVSIRLDEKTQAGIPLLFPSIVNMKDKSSSIENFVNTARQQLKVDNILRMKKGEILLDEVEVIGYKNPLTDLTHRKNLMIEHRPPDFIVPKGNLEHLPPTYDFSSTLQIVIPGFMMFSPSDLSSPPTICITRRMGACIPPIVIIDGVKIDISEHSGYDRLAMLQPSLIEAIEVIRSPIMAYSSMSLGGLIAIYTKKGNDAKPQSIGLRKLLLNGYSKQREFYHPNYEVDKQTDIPDLRTTIAWFPLVKTDAQGKATLSFYTADLPTSYEVQVEGMSAGQNSIVGTGKIAITIK